MLCAGQDWLESATPFAALGRTQVFDCRVLRLGAIKWSHSQKQQTGTATRVQSTRASASLVAQVLPRRSAPNKESGASSSTDDGSASSSESDEAGQFLQSWPGHLHVSYVNEHWAGLVVCFLACSLAVPLAS